MSTIVKTSEIPGPPFACPECADDGKRVTFMKRPALGTHRIRHGVYGTSTGSVAYRKFKTIDARGHNAKPRTYTKRIQHATSFNKLGGKRGYTKKPKTNPLLDMLENPQRVISGIDMLLMQKREEVASFQKKIEQLNTSVTVLERFRSTIEPAVAFSEVA